MYTESKKTKIKNIIFTGKILKIEFESNDSLTYDFKIISQPNETVNEHVKRLETNTYNLKELVEQFKSNNIFSYIGKKVELGFANGKLSNFIVLED